MVNLLLAGLLACFLATTPATLRNAPPMTTLRIAFLGDSMTNGTGDPAMLGWVGRLCASAAARGHDVTAYNCGIRRNTSADIAARWHAEATARLPAEHPSALVFCFGVNDCVEENGAPRVPPEASLAHAASILTAAKTLAPTLFIGPPPIDDPETNARTAALDRQYATLCATLAIPYLPTLAPLLANPHWIPEARAGDGAHPATRGYAAMAALIDPWPPWRAWLP